MKPSQLQSSKLSPADIASFQGNGTIVADQLGTLADGHRAQALASRMPGVTSTLQAYRDVNAQRLAVPATDPALAPDPLHPGERPIDPGSNKPRKGKTDPVTGEVLDPTQPDQQPGNTPNLTGMGMPLDVPINLTIRVKQHPESVGVELQVGPLMDQFDATMNPGDKQDNTKVFAALIGFYTNIVQSFNRVVDGKGNIHDVNFPMTAEAVAMGIVAGIAGVDDAVVAGLPEVVSE